MAKEHKWLIYEIALVRDPNNQDSLLRMMLCSTDQRRKVKFFTLRFTPETMTLEDFSGTIREGYQKIQIEEGKRPKKNKAPTVDPRQIEMFPEVPNANLAT
jgi:hypothetical protein